MHPIQLLNEASALHAKLQPLDRAAQSSDDKIVRIANRSYLRVCRRISAATMPHKPNTIPMYNILIAAAGYHYEPVENAVVDYCSPLSDEHNCGGKYTHEVNVIYNSKGWACLFGVRADGNYEIWAD